MRVGAGVESANGAERPRQVGGAVSPLARLADMQAKMLEKSEWVGDRFADEARAMHLGDTDARAIHGSATAAEARSLLAEGVPVAPLPLPLVPPSQVN